MVSFLLLSWRNQGLPKYEGEKKNGPGPLKERKVGSWSQSIGVMVV